MNYCAAQSESTARICIYAYFPDSLENEVVDTLAKKYDLIVLLDSRRYAVPRLRSTSLLEHGSLPVVLVYKDGMTLIGPNNPWKSKGDSVFGGGATVGGFWHFDSLFRGFGYDADTCFLMGSEQSVHTDAENRVRAGSSDYWNYRWVMDWGKEYWASFFACSTKTQCLRNYTNGLYDSTYFDGVFIDNVLHYNREYGIYAQRYWNPDSQGKSNNLLQDAVIRFLRTVVKEYKNPHTPHPKPSQILAIGNTNGIFKQAGLWEEYLQYLDGGMEESFAQTWQDWQRFGDWQRMIHEIQYAESQGKLCLVRTRIDNFKWESFNDPLSVVVFDTAQMMFGFTSYLLGCDSMSYFSFQGDYQHIFWAPILEVDIGAPKGSCVIIEDSLAYREFEKGLVYCNPSTSERFVSVPADRYLVVEPSGNAAIAGRIEIPPYHGVVFRKKGD